MQKGSLDFSIKRSVVSVVLTECLTDETVTLTTCTGNPVFKVVTLITGSIRKWLEKNAKDRGVTFITGFGRSDHHQTATSHQPFHPGLCVSLSRCRLPPVINHSTLAYVCHYPGADCHQSSTIPPWPMCATIQGPSILSEVDSTTFEKGGP